MNLRLAARTAQRGGWFSRADALAAGYSDADLRAHVTDGRWVRLCRGTYAEPGADPPATPWEWAVWRHMRLAKAAWTSLSGRAVISHQSALLLHGADVSDLDLSRVHVTRIAGPGRTTAQVCQHLSGPPMRSTVVGGVEVVTGPRAVVDAIRLATYPVAVAVVDAALRQGLATAGQLREYAELVAGSPGSRAAFRAIAFGNPLAESVGESRLRLVLADLGLPEPTLQAEIRDDLGRLVGRVDFLLDQWSVVVEFDGRIKYSTGDAAVLVAEKLREDRLRDLGYQVVRAGWSDLTQPAGFIGRLNRAIDRSRRASRPAGTATPATAEPVAAHLRPQASVLSGVS
ncbi:putative AbiEi antitoxin of type IV toxin-antitoxin system [Kribbella amoyensis]|uniref:Putative AbiEi antitoxin of type IV toxin-antitoxin system n=1 Tax=Kribbella amoyensis TaxID=996641 RepID=A0A561B2T0_9ACTN|nr:type IV toxin-antitoxin system AbiEi family antitoxin domain-containing protein [Kribbella amoyensis]TWD73169.1 putative AbiEi antitoxin of type IV toxin-antitoxin system [Kribbella amoyensis]